MVIETTEPFMLKHYDDRIEELPVLMIVRRRDVEMIQRRCFRNPQFRKAGTFFVWDNVGQLFKDQDFTRSLFEDARTASEEGAYNECSFMFNSRSVVGWSWTDDLGCYSMHDLEPFTFDPQFHPVTNVGAHGLMLKNGRRHRKAPHTSLVTVVYEFKKEDGAFSIRVTDIYPGYDVGPLSGDVTRNSGRMFFHWNQPGA